MTLCSWCESPIPPDSGRTLYCTDNCRKRAGEDQARSWCVDCDAILSAGSAWQGELRCQPCEQALRRWRHEVRLSIVEGCWHDGWPQREIGVAIGRGDYPNSVSPLVAELRDQGRIGYRYPGAAARAAA